MLDKTPRGRGARPRSLRVALLHTQRAPGLSFLLDEDPERGWSYELVAAVATDAESAELARLDAARVPALVHDLRAFSRARGVRRDDLTVRPEFDRATLDLLAPFEPDLLVLSGYLHIATAPLLEAFPDRAINIHDADLAVLGADGRPRYRGLRSTRDAVFAGASETRSTVHLVTPEVDVGPLLLRSWAFPTHPMILEAGAWNAPDILKAYAYAQREWMMRAAWGPMLSHVIRRFAGGAVRLLDGRAVVAGALGPEQMSARVNSRLGPAAEAASQ
jgi:phosphoribosylglycinamide formyltransferase 1